MPARKKISLAGFQNFVEITEGQVFMMTDDPKTQSFFLDKYGQDKILVYDQVGKILGDRILFLYL